MLAKPEEARIVKAILSLSQALGLHTTAEGIENTQVLERLTGWAVKQSTAGSETLSEQAELARH